MDSPRPSNSNFVLDEMIRAIAEKEKADLAVITANRLAAIVESSDDAIIGKDLNGIITSWNHGAEVIVGYSADEMVGASILRLIPEERHHEERHILETIRRGGSVRHFETIRQTKDGRRIDVSVTASPIKDASGRIIGVSKVARDITERKRAEEAESLRLKTQIERGEEEHLRALAQSDARLRFALDSVNIGYWDLDLDKQIAIRSMAHDRIFGYSELQPVWSFEHAIKHILPEDRSEAEKSFQHAIETQSGWNFECRIRRQDGEIRWISAIGRYTQGVANGAGRITGIVQDITDRKRAEQLKEASPRAA